jgi:hypothetical protein
MIFINDLQNFLSYVDDIDMRLRNRQADGVTQGGFDGFMSEIAIGKYSKYLIFSCGPFKYYVTL